MEIIPQLVIDVQAEPRAKVADLADKHHVSTDIILGIRRGDYDDIVAEAMVNAPKPGTPATGKVRVCHSRRLQTIMLYDEKGYTPSGKSIMGALEMSADETLIRCHECGGWFENLGAHIAEHEITAREYKIKHRLKVTASLLNEPLRLKYVKDAQRRWNSLTHKERKRRTEERNAARAAIRAKHAKDAKGTKKHWRSSRLSTHYQMASLNIKQACPAQTLHKLRKLCDELGRAPTHAEIDANSISRYILEKKYGSLAAAVQLCAYEAETKKQYGRKELIALLKNFYKQNGRHPSQSDFNRGLLPARTTYFYRFGSLAAAFRKAGIPIPAATTIAMKREIVKAALRKQPKPAHKDESLIAARKTDKAS